MDLIETLPASATWLSFSGVIPLGEWRDHGRHGRAHAGGAVPSYTTLAHKPNVANGMPFSHWVANSRYCKWKI